MQTIGNENLHCSKNEGTTLSAIHTHFASAGEQSVPVREQCNMTELMVRQDDDSPEWWSCYLNIQIEAFSIRHLV
jgi:hypothetical protein